MASQSKKALSLATRTSFRTNLYNDRVYAASEVETFLLDSGALSAAAYKKNKRHDLLNIPAAFDIETSSFYGDYGKQGIMYHWQFGINGLCIVGRTWEEYLVVMQYVSGKLRLSQDRRLVVFVRNLGFEFQFIRKHHEWSEMLAMSERRPIYAVNELGFEFRCSLILSGYSLRKTSELLRTYPVEKLELDYDKLRTWKTPLTADETAYNVNDIRVDMAYFQEMIEKDGNVTRIQLTKTGYVRKYCRDFCMYDGSHKHNMWKATRYRRMIDALTMTPEEYVIAKEAFAGGFTHTNAYKVRRTYEDVHSQDFTSSYPYVMITFDCFPMSRGRKTAIHDKQHFLRMIRDYACIFRVKVWNIRGKETVGDHIISLSKCRALHHYGDDNGRVIYADYLELTVTELDWRCIRAFYDMDEYQVDEMWYYIRGRLPTAFVESVINLYEKKTTLKGIEEKEDEYMWGKEQLNSCYGMMVTDIVRPEIVYDGEWREEDPDLDEMINNYNTSVKRFTSYLWGLYVTAAARKNLYTAILELGPNDYIYADTDSVKYVNHEAHEEYFRKYNEKVIRTLEATADYHGIQLERLMPKTIKGVQKPIGVWDYEGCYSRFRALGAKRYMTEKDGKLSITVSGVNKKYAVPYLLKTYKDPFDAFDDDLDIPAEATGKLTHCYIDEPFDGNVTDYLGNTAECHELSAIHMEPCPYSLSLSQKYINYLMEIEEVEI